MAESENCRRKQYVTSSKQQGPRQEAGHLQARDSEEEEEGDLEALESLRLTVGLGGKGGRGVRGVGGQQRQGA
jgi:hypothetical protein